MRVRKEVGVGVPRSLSVARYRPLSEVVYEELRQAICAGVLKPGERLRQEDLASQLGVSRMPVREALQRLAKEGLVEFQPHRGAVVRQPVLQEVQEVHDALVILQRTALELAVTRVTDAEIEAIEGIHNALVRKVQSDRPSDLGVLNRRFHRALVQPCRLPKLVECIESLWDWHPQAGDIILSRRGAEAIAEHEAMLEALRARDLPRLHSLAEEHVRKAAMEFLVAMKECSPESGDDRVAG